MHQLIRESLGVNPRVDQLTGFYNTNVVHVYTKDKEPTMQTGGGDKEKEKRSTSTILRTSKKEKKHERLRNRTKSLPYWKTQQAHGGYPGGKYGGAQWGAGLGKGGGQWGHGGGYGPAAFNPWNQGQSSWHGGWQQQHPPGKGVPQQPQLETMKEVRDFVAPKLASKLRVPESTLWQWVAEKQYCVLHGGEREGMKSARGVAVFCKHKDGCQWSHSSTNAKHDAICPPANDGQQPGGGKQPEKKGGGGGKQPGKNPKGPRPPW
eukprot:g6244.t1